jgi:hypothetical protein
MNFQVGDFVREDFELFNNYRVFKIVGFDPTKFSNNYKMIKLESPEGRLHYGWSDGYKLANEKDIAGFIAKKMSL